MVWPYCPCFSTLAYPAAVQFFTSPAESLGLLRGERHLNFMTHCFHASSPGPPHLGKWCSRRLNGRDVRRQGRYREWQRRVRKHPRVVIAGGLASNIVPCRLQRSKASAPCRLAPLPFGEHDCLSNGLAVSRSCKRAKLFPPNENETEVQERISQRLASELRESCPTSGAKHCTSEIDT